MALYAVSINGDEILFELNLIQISHLATALNASVGGGEGANGVYNKLNKKFSGCLEEERRSAERAVISQVGEPKIDDFLNNSHEERTVLAHV